MAGSLPQDILTLNLPTKTNSDNTLTADASQLQGALHVNAADPLAQILSPYGLTTIILSAVNPLLAVFIVGTDPFPLSANYQIAQTTVNFGTGQLARIQGNVTVSKAVLNINDSTAAQPSNLSLSDTTFNNWVIPNTNLTPALHYSNLYKTLTVSAGAGDKFELDHTPASIDEIVLNNATAAQDEIYSTNWSVPITANGNWSIFLGSFLHPDGSPERIKQLVGLAIPLTLNFSGDSTGHVVFDGDGDPDGARIRDQWQRQFARRQSNRRTRCHGQRIPRPRPGLRVFARRNCRRGSDSDRAGQILCGWQVAIDWQPCHGGELDLSDRALRKRFARPAEYVRLCAAGVQHRERARLDAAGQLLGGAANGAESIAALTGRLADKHVDGGRRRFLQLLFCRQSSAGLLRDSVHALRSDRRSWRAALSHRDQRAGPPIVVRADRLLRYRPGLSRADAHRAGSRSRVSLECQSDYDGQPREFGRLATARGVSYRAAEPDYTLAEILTADPNQSANFWVRIW